ncbi:hypothetical protein A2U01_0095813, partial [Trifolium medium]|nr:hypothetical protein [Trifolium medium]
MGRGRPYDKRGKKPDEGGSKVLNSGRGNGRGRVK